MTKKLPRMTLRRLLGRLVAGSAISGMLCAAAAFLTGLGAQAQVAPPNLSAPGVDWAGFVAPASVIMATAATAVPITVRRTQLDLAGEVWAEPLFSIVVISFLHHLKN